MKSPRKIVLIIVTIIVLLFAWAPWITEEYAKNAVLTKVCSSVYQKDGSEICMLNSNFQGGTGNWEGTGMLTKDVAAGIIWLPFGRYVTNFEGMVFVPFYDPIL